jgi:hypothetical protein
MPIHYDILRVEQTGDKRIKVYFHDGLCGEVEFRQPFFRGVFSHLVDPREFAKVCVFDGYVTWPGNLDLAPDAMYDKIKENGGLWVVGE